MRSSVAGDRTDPEFDFMCLVCIEGQKCSQGTTEASVCHLGGGGLVPVCPQSRFNHPDLSNQTNCDAAKRPDNC